MSEGTPYGESLGVRVEALDAEGVRLRIPYKDENSNPGRALHGGVAASAIGIAGVLASEAGFSAGPAAERGTLDLAVDYLAAAIGEDIVAAGTVLRRGKELAYVDVEVRTDAGKRIAKGLVTHRVFDPSSAPGAAARQLARPPAGLEDLGDGPVPELARAIVATPFIARLGVRIGLMHDGHSRLEMPYRADNAGAAGGVHEGALAALLDTTGAMASWSVAGLNLRYKASTVAIHVNFHAPARGEDVVGHGRTLRRNNEIFLNAVTLVGRESGRVLATGSVTYRIVVPD